MKLVRKCIQKDDCSQVTRWWEKLGVYNDVKDIYLYLYMYKQLKHQKMGWAKIRIFCSSNIINYVSIIP